MALGRMEHEWNQTSHVMWVLACAFGDGKKQFKPADFNPFAGASQTKAEKAAEAAAAELNRRVRVAEQLPPELRVASWERSGRASEAIHGKRT